MLNGAVRQGPHDAHYCHPSRQSRPYHARGWRDNIPATTGTASAVDRTDRMSMDGMAHAPGPSHARKTARDHLWVLVIIAGFALYDVWKAWSELGAKSGFGHAGWTLTVIVEVFWLYVLWAWLAGAAGPRSRKFARRSAAGVFLLSLVGQASSRLNVHRTPSAAVVVFVSVLPVVVLALIAFLVHYRQLDRAEAEVAVRAHAEAQQEAQAEAAASDERAALRAQLEALHDALGSAQQEAVEAHARADKYAAEWDAMARKLAAQKPNRTRTKDPNAGRKAVRKAPNAVPNGTPNAAPETTVPEDFDARTQALEVWLGNPKISGKDLGAAVGLGERWGQLRKNEFATASNGQRLTADPEE